MYGLPACTSASGCFKQVDSTGKPATFARRPEGLQRLVGRGRARLCKWSAPRAPTARSCSSRSTATSGDFSGAVNDSRHARRRRHQQQLRRRRNARTTPSVQPSRASSSRRSTGDNGYGVSSPATYTGVVAVGGTSLAKSSSSRGLGRDGLERRRQRLQRDGRQAELAERTRRCSMRVNADVSAVADPNTGVAVYCSDSTAAAGLAGRRRDERGRRPSSRAPSRCCT